MDEFADRVALITGAARGQGRSHALALASRGCDVVLVDICADIASCAYPLSRRDDLDKTAAECEAFGVRVGAHVADVRERDQLSNVFASGMYGIGRGKLDFLLCNAGIGPVVGRESDLMAAFDDCMAVMVRGVHLSIKFALQWFGTWGSVVITGSTAARKSLCPNVDAMSNGLAGYHAAKTAGVGLMRYYATALAERNIRVNIVHPCGVDTPMTVNEACDRWYAEHPERLGPVTNRLPVNLLPPADVTDAVLYLLRAQHVTGTELLVDAGCTA